MFQPAFIEARNLDEAWFLILKALYERGRRYKITEGSHKGHERIALDFVAGFIHNPHERPLAPQVPPNVVDPPTTDAYIEEYFTDYLMNSELAPNEDYKYAVWIVGGNSRLYIQSEDVDSQPLGVSSELRALPGGRIHELPFRVPDQLTWVIKHFKEKGFGNEHCYITIGDPTSNLAYDVEYSDETNRRTSPCLRGLDFRVIEDEGVPKLFTHVIYRSWDAYHGWPTNMGGFTLLNEYVAAELGIEPGPLAFSCKSLHCYDFHFEVVRARLNKN